MRGLDNIINLETEPNFWINDIGLFVPPTSISMHKEGLDYSIKSLRTRVSTKILSGNGIYHAQINLTFPPDALLQLHRLISQVRNNPFVFIENDFIKSSIHGREDYYYFTVMGLNIINHPSSVGSFNVELDLRFFNHKVYDPYLKYVNDWGYYVSSEGKRKKISFSATSDLENEGTEAIILEETLITNSPSSVRDIQESINLESDIKTFASYGVLKPKDSKAYKRYCNYLQNIYLEESFDIKINDLYLKNNLDLKSKFDKGDIGFHEVLESGEISEALLNFRNSLIKEIFKSSSITKFIFRNFVVMQLNPSVIKKLKAITDAGVTPEMSSSEKEAKRKSNFSKLSKDLISENPKGTQQSIEKTREYRKVNRDIGDIENNESIGTNVNYFPLTDEPIYLFLRGENSLEVTNKKMLQDNISSVYPVFSCEEGIIKKITNNSISIELFNNIYITYKNITLLPQTIIKENKSVRKGHLLGYITDGNPLTFISSDRRIIDYYSNDFENLEEPVETKEYNDISDLKEINKYIQNNYSMYTGVSGLENILESNNSMGVVDYSLEDIISIVGEVTEEESKSLPSEDLKNPNSTITAVSGSLRNIVTSIPILGQEFPVHQYLGSIEPTYQINIIGKKILGEQLPDIIEFLEQGRANAQYYAKNFSMIPDSGNFIVESLITKLLGSYKVNNISYIQEKTTNNSEAFPIIQHNFIVNSCDTYSIEGSPLATGFNFRFSESKSYREESLRPIASNSLSTDYKRKVLDILEMTEVVSMKKPSLETKSETSLIENREVGTWSMLNWKTKYFNSHQWYSKGVPSIYRDGTLITYMNSQEQNNDMNQDYNSYLLAKILDNIQDILNHYQSPNGNQNQKYILSFSSTFDIKSKNNRSTISNHFHGCAVDTKVVGMNVMEYAALIEILLEENVIKNPKINSVGLGSLGLGIYGKEGNNIAIKMNLDSDPTNRKKSGFIHIDLNAVLSSDGNKSPSGIKNINGDYYFHEFKNTRRRWVGESGDDKFGNDSSSSINSNKFWKEDIIQTKNDIRSYVITAIKMSRGVVASDILEDTLSLQQIISSNSQ